MNSSLLLTTLFTSLTTKLDRKLFCVDNQTWQKNLLRQKAVKGVAWSMIGSYSNKFIQFVISLVLARLLTPADYGLIGMLGFLLDLPGQSSTVVFPTLLSDIKTEPTKISVQYFSSTADLAF